MVKVLGIGGVFFRSKDPSGLAQWYHQHLGIDPVPSDATQTPWRTQEGFTVFSPFAGDTDYFPQDRSFMLNFRVADLDAAIAELSAEGIACSDVQAMQGVGRFSRLHDPEGNAIELWEADSAMEA